MIIHQMCYRDGVKLWEEIEDTLKEYEALSGEKERVESSVMKLKGLIDAKSNKSEMCSADADG